MAETILSSPFFTELVLPFLLVFALIFAILERTKILGEDKKQVNAIVAFVVGLIFVSFSNAVGIAVNLIGIMAVVAVILLVFLLLFGFASQDKEFTMPKGLKVTFGILIGLVVIVALLFLTGSADFIIIALTGGSGTNIVANAIFVIVIIAAVAIVLATGKKQ